MTLRWLASLPLSLLALPIVLSLAACNSLQSIEVLPSAGATILTGVGQTAQFTAVGTGQMGTAAPTTSNITGSVIWSVSNSSVATINADGLATSVGAGYTQVMAQSNGIIATSDLTVTVSASGPGSGTPSLTVTPGTVTETFTGETTQFNAIGNLTGVGNSQNLTTQVQWVSSNTQVATIDANGLATATGAGTTTITAQSGAVSAVAILTVSLSSTAPSTPSLTLIPGSVSATGAGAITQFIAIGNLTGNGAMQDLTDDVAWSSSAPGVAVVTQSGLATTMVNPAVGMTYTTTITAIGTTTNGSVITATVPLTVVSSNSGTTPTANLSVYETGTGTGSVATANGNPPLIDCGGGGTVCGQTFTQGTIVTLTATPVAGSTFDGWTANCAVATPTSCTITMTGNETVGAIFN